jgi:cephalosporin hydroxylase
MDDRKDFAKASKDFSIEMSRDLKLRQKALDLIEQSDKFNWSYQWTWLGLPIIQMPPDIVATQEIIWEKKPQLIIETGVARGGSLIFYASILELIGEGRVIGIDVEIRSHNRDSIERHPLSKRIELIESDSLSLDLNLNLSKICKDYERVMVILDSNHTHDHVLNELRLYSKFVTQGQYLIVADTIVEHIPEQSHRPRPWGVGNNPLTALNEFMTSNNSFIHDEVVNGKLLISSSPGGYLIRK